MIWTAVVIWPYGITHLCTESNLEQTVQDLEGRECKVYEIKHDVKSWMIDNPGMLWKDRQYVEIRLDGLKLEIPATDVGSFLLSIRKLKVRKYPDGTKFFKLKGWAAGIVLTPSQKIALQASLEEVYEESKQKADEDVQKLYEIRNELSKSGNFPKVKLMNNNTGKN